ncbi:AAA family ATPase [Dietzia cinnamea]|uniref:AAA family ATPase n=1 Tax=Dietzia cinnamea TaxID=321318 RepID=UPI00223BC523|nr:AAA family ATPase [Dietzia cinnamea]MCT2264487.1 AAA family ATPase [Dietzia cinnamea]
MNDESRPTVGETTSRDAQSTVQNTPAGTRVVGLEKIPAGARVVHVLGQGSAEYLDALNAAGYPSVALTMPWEDFAAAPAGLPSGVDLRLVCRTGGEAGKARAAKESVAKADRAAGRRRKVTFWPCEGNPAAMAAAGRVPVAYGSTVPVFVSLAEQLAPPPADVGTGKSTDRTRPRTFQEEVDYKVRQKRADREANRILAKEDADLLGAQFPEIVPLTEELKIPDSPVQYRVNGLWPVGGKVVLAAQYKAGKTTMVQNLARALADGTTFLGHPVEGRRRVAVIDTEMDKDLLRRLYREQGIGNTDDVTVVPLRGRLSTFDLLDPYTRARWVSALAGYQVVILDCLRPVLDATGLDEDKEAGQFLRAFDALLLEMTPEDADVNTEGVVVHHTGHDGERARGSSVILDWPDASWRLNLADSKRPDSTRFFAAYGRGVNVGESALVLQAGNHLAVDPEGGSRADVKRSAAEVALLDELRTLAEPTPKTKVLARVKARAKFSRDALRDAFDAAVDRGVIVTAQGPNNSVLVSLADQSDGDGEALDEDTAAITEGGEAT